jgi:hypothetical protein
VYPSSLAGSFVHKLLNNLLVTDEQCLYPVVFKMFMQPCYLRMFLVNFIDQNVHYNEKLAIQNYDLYVNERMLAGISASTSGLLAHIVSNVLSVDFPLELHWFTPRFQLYVNQYFKSYLPVHLNVELVPEYAGSLQSGVEVLSEVDYMYALYVVYQMQMKVYNLHGVYIQDLHAGNVLYKPDSDGVFQFGVVDFGASSTGGQQSGGKMRLTELFFGSVKLLYDFVEFGVCDVRNFDNLRELVVVLRREEFFARHYPPGRYFELLAERVMLHLSITLSAVEYATLLVRMPVPNKMAKDFIEKSKELEVLRAEKVS